MMDGYRARSIQPEHVMHFWKVVGTGAADPTKEEGVGITITRTGAGAYLATWSENPGQYLGSTATFEATTITALKGYTVVFGVYSATTKSVAFQVYNSTFAATDLAATQHICVVSHFARTSL